MENSEQMKMSILNSELKKFYEQMELYLQNGIRGLSGFSGAFLEIEKVVQSLQDPLFEKKLQWGTYGTDFLPKEEIQSESLPNLKDLDKDIRKLRDTFEMCTHASNRAQLAGASNVEQTQKEPMNWFKRAICGFSAFCKETFDLNDFPMVAASTMVGYFEQKGQQDLEKFQKKYPTMNPEVQKDVEKQEKGVGLGQKMLDLGQKATLNITWKSFNDQQLEQEKNAVER